MRTAYTILVGKPEGKSQLVKLRRIWEHNIKMHINEYGYEVHSAG